MVALPGEGIEEVVIYAELCTLVLERSATGEAEAVFSYPEFAAPNYENHFALDVDKTGGTLAISTDYENGRWDTAFAPISGFDADGFKQNAVLTVRLPEQVYGRVSLHLVTPGDILTISGVKASAVELRVGTGDLVVYTDQAFPDVSVEHMGGQCVAVCARIGGAAAGFQQNRRLYPSVAGRARRLRAGNPA